MIRILRNLRHDLFYRWVTVSGYRLETFGQACPWTVVANALGPDSVVVSAGAGYDISFEKDLVARYGCKVLLLDPSPTGTETMDSAENHDPRIRFKPVGLAESDRTYEFEVPGVGEQASFLMAASGGSASGRQIIGLPCLSLPTLMRQEGIDAIDLLKMDIEGFEYGVLDQIMDLSLSVRQICVEFHHFALPQYTNSDTIRRILAMRKAGFDLAHKIHWDHTFIRRQS